MKIQFAATIQDRDGKDIVDSATKKPVTLGQICWGTLDITFQGEEREGLKPKLRRAELQDKIAEAEKSLVPLELLDADREMLKDRLALRSDLPVSLIARMVKLLDTDVAPPKPAAVPDAA